MPGAPPFDIRRGVPADSDTLAEFNTRMAVETEGVRLDPAVINAGVRAALSDEAKATYFVAEMAGRVVGQLMVTREWSDWRNGDIWWVQSVYVHPDHRRRGVFRSLYDHARAEAEKVGAVGMRLYVEENNAAAQAVYRRLGMSATCYRVMQEMFD